MMLYGEVFELSVKDSRGVLMEFIADIVIIAIIVISVIIGFRKGLVRMLFKCLTVVAAAVIAFYAGPVVGSYIKATGVYASMSSGVSEKLCKYFDKIVLSGIEDAMKTKSDFESTPFAETLTRLGFDSDKMLEHYNTAIVSGAQNIKEEYVDGITDYVLSCLANALGHLVVFVVAFFVIKLLGILIEKIFDLSVLKAVNKVGGSVLGAVFGIAVSYVVCMALEVLLPYIPENPVVYMGMADKTFIYRYFINFNPAILLFAGLSMKK